MIYIKIDLNKYKEAKGLNQLINRGKNPWLYVYNVRCLLVVRLSALIAKLRILS